MSHRLGKCSACGAEFKVPASFTHDVARCKVCSGVVHLGPVGGAPPEPPKPAAQPMPAKRVVKKDDGPVEVAASGAEEKKKERGTLARLKAERAAAAAAAQGGGEAKPATAKPAAAKPAVAKAKATGAKAGARASGSRAKASASKGRASARAGAGRKGKDDGGAKGRRGRGAKEEKKKSPMALIGVIALLVIGGGAAWYFMNADDGGDNTANAQEPTDTTEVAANEAADTAADTTDDTATPEEAAAPEEDITPEEDTAEPEPAPEPELVDMSTLPELGRARGTTDEEWEQMNQWVADFFDPSAGAAGPRAGRKLEEMGRKAFPVIVNAMKDLDFSTDEGYRAGFSGQLTLEKLLNGNNFGWRNQDVEGYDQYDQKVVTLYHGLWKQVEENIFAWVNAAKLKTKDPEEAERLMSLYGDGEGGEDAEPAADEDDEFAID